MLLIPEKEVVFEEDVLASRFIAILSPLRAAASFPEFYESVQTRYPKARHYPYAYKVLSNEKLSDDGEPPRSVGLSLLALLQKKDLSYASLVVVRYFGGTKLGLGRLSRTYRETAENCLQSSSLAELKEGLEVEALFSYPAFDRLQKEAGRLLLQYTVLDYGEKIRLLLNGDAKIVQSFLLAFPETKVTSSKETFYQRSLVL